MDRLQNNLQKINLPIEDVLAALNGLTVEEVYTTLLEVKRAIVRTKEEELKAIHERINTVEGEFKIINQAI